MLSYKVEPVVCDFGVMKNNELLVILNSSANAQKIVEILIEDTKRNDFKTYSEWLPELEKKEKKIVIDDNGFSQLKEEGNEMALMAEEEAHKYFLMNTFGRKIDKK